jgi:hypothetical protein
MTPNQSEHFIFGWMLWVEQHGCLRRAVIVAGLFACLVASGRWYEFKGLYVNMQVSEVKKLGLKCTMGQIYEICQPPTDDKRFATIGGAPVKETGVVIKARST